MATQPEKRKRGRPTKRTPEREQVVLNSVKVGCSIEQAAAIAEIGARTLERWMQADPEFASRVESARVHPVEKAAVQLNRLVEKGNLGAICFLLKTRGGEAWAERKVSRVRVKVPRVETVAELATAMKAVTDDMLAGKMTVEEAERVTEALDRQRRALESAEFQRKLDDLERRLAERDEPGNARAR